MRGSGTAVLADAHRLAVAGGPLMMPLIIQKGPGSRPSLVAARETQPRWTPPALRRVVIRNRRAQAITLSEPLRVLTPQQIYQIDCCLAEIEAYGRVTLIKQNGRLRFIEKTESLEANRSGR